MENTNKKTKTHFNRYRMMVAFEIFSYLKNQEKEATSEVSVRELESHIQETLHFGLDSLCMHLRDLHKIDVIRVSDHEDLRTEVIQDGNVRLTDYGLDVVYILKDIKYQNIYKGIRRKQSGDNVVKKHSRTFYNRHSLSIVLDLFNKGIQSYKTMQENEENVVFEDFIFQEYSLSELQSLSNYSEASLKMHLFYLTKKNLLEEFEDGMYRLTDFGLSIARILKDIKYQSIYNMNFMRLEK